MRFLRPCALSSQKPLSTLEMLPEVRLSTHRHVFVSAAAGLSMRSVSGLGWREQAGRTARGSWWRRPARTAAPTTHQAAASAAPSSEGHQPRECRSGHAVTAALVARVCLALVMEQLLVHLLLCSLPFARRRRVLGLSWCCLLGGGTMAVSLGGRALGYGGGCTLCQKAPHLPHFPAWRGSWGLKFLVECRAFHPQGQDGGSPAPMPGCYISGPQGIARSF